MPAEGKRREARDSENGNRSENDKTRAADIRYRFGSSVCSAKVRHTSYAVKIRRGDISNRPNDFHVKTPALTRSGHRVTCRGKIHPLNSNDGENNEEILPINVTRAAIK